MSNNNYPLGTSATDPNAPWNEKEPAECSVCKGSGVLGSASDEEGTFQEECSHCDGTGDEP